MPRVTLTANQTTSITTKANTLNLALLSGEIYYKAGSAVTGTNDMDAFVLNEDLRPDSLYFGNSSAKTVHFRAGAAGATFQYREE